jgi:hypothetical protein
MRATEVGSFATLQRVFQRDIVRAVVEVFGSSSRGNRADGLRVFVSYCSEERSAAERIVGWLSAVGADPIWDAQLRGGTRFRLELRSFIENAHIFLVLLTPSSMARPWVLQEIGYATALGIPIVPVSTGPLPEGLIGELQAVHVRADWSDVERHLAEVPWSQLATTQRTGPQTVLATLVRSPFDRTTLLGQYSRRVEALGATGVVRQRAGLSTFCIPDEPIAHGVWTVFDGKRQRTRELHAGQREERLALGAHAMAGGCKLMVDPEAVSDALGSEARKVRLRNLHRFLTQAGSRVQAITHVRGAEGNLTILGNWWAAESLALQFHGYGVATFTWHAGLVKRFADEFDEEFSIRCEERGIKAEESAQFALAEIERVLKSIG